MHRDAIATGVKEFVEILGGITDHQVGIEWEVGEFSESRDYDRAISKVWDEVAVHHIQVKQVGASGFEQFDLAVQVAKVAPQH